MASFKQRIETLEQQSCVKFSGYAVVASWDFDFKTSDQGLAAYKAANDPIPEERQVALMGWSD